MNRLERLSRPLALSLTASLCAGFAAAQVFGTNDYNVTVVSALAFNGGSFNVSGSLGRFGVVNVDQHFYATVDVPAGVVIDYIGLNNFNDGTPGVVSVALRGHQGNGIAVYWGGVSSTPHASWSTDKNPTPLNLDFGADQDNVMILDVEIAPSASLQFFGFAELWWRRKVKPGPAAASFTDVPTSHPFFKFVEALHAAGVTNGYPDGRFGVNDPVTRGQMAVFLSTALGLHWPY